MQNLITEKQALHNNKGELQNPGWAKDLLFEYSREHVKAAKIKIKEWDYYCVLSGNKGAAFTIADNGYLGFVAVTVFDFDTPHEISNSVMIPFPMGRFNMPPSSKQGNVLFQNKQITLKFTRENQARLIEIDYKHFHKKQNLTGKIRLNQPDLLESMVIATPFAKKPKAFYYNQKINCMQAHGELTLGSKTIHFKPTDSYGVLDWGRGVWTYANTWYWGSASGRVNNKLFGFNIGYGFGNTSAATENTIFYEGKTHKFDQVSFHIPPNDFMKPWKFTSNDARFEMDFTPIIDRHSSTNLVLLKSIQHQVFGRFTGKAVLDTGETIVIKNFLGFAEQVTNHW